MNILLGQTSNGPLTLELSRINRHGLIAGATGTGKTVTLQTLAEQLSQAGCNVILSDVKGDLSGISQPGDAPKWATERYTQMGLSYTPAAVPSTFWDVYATNGFPARATIAEIGPLLLARMLDLNDTQTGVLHIVFKVAESENLLLLDTDDLRKTLAYVGENAKKFSSEYGNVSSASLGTIQRALLALESEGATQLFGEPALQVADLLANRGMVHIIDAQKLMNSPRAYATFLLYLLSELFEQLPEVGDLPVPKLAFFFDEAHLLFTDAPKPLLEKVTQLVRLIRSKGVGVFFVTQQPSDVPEPVLAQLGNRIQHALRAATPQGQKDIKVAATTMASNPAFKTADVLPNLAVGEALVSVLDAKGIPTPVQRTFILPPQSRVGTISAAERNAVQNQSPLRGRYENPLNRVSAAEVLAQRLQQQPTSAGVQTVEADKPSPFATAVNETLFGTKRRQGLVEAAAKSVVRNMAGQLGRALLKGMFSR
ncbi:MAG TPA: helicase HerA-like domain-containing protein [Alphaproteobacteria bacterium]|nr:helicase HerA-like domain-containing protein [Alphaproteobacteria bacterium]